VDGNKFTDIGRISAIGNSSIKQDYNYADQHATGNNSNVLYYKLTMVDRSESLLTSKVLMVHVKSRGVKFSFSPNPVKQQLNVTVEPEGATNVCIRIIDRNGKQVYQQIIAWGINL
jgi:hypothetical protein